MAARSMAQFNKWFYGGSQGPYRVRKYRKSIAKSTRLAVMERDRRTCQHCGTTEQPSLDHIIPRSKGGTNAQSNLQVLCKPCNERKADTL